MRLNEKRRALTGDGIDTGMFLHSDGLNEIKIPPQSVDNIIDTIVIFNTDSNLSGFTYDKDTGLFTANSTGCYTFQGSISLSGAIPQSTKINIYLQRNDTFVARGCTCAGRLMVDSMLTSVSGEVDLNSGDTIALIVNQNSGDVCHILNDKAHNYFSLT